MKPCRNTNCGNNVSDDAVYCSTGCKAEMMRGATKYTPTVIAYLKANWLTLPIATMAAHVGVKPDALKKAVTGIRASGIEIPNRPCGGSVKVGKYKYKPVGIAKSPEKAKKVVVPQKAKSVEKTVINKKGGKSGENWAVQLPDKKPIYIAENDRPPKVELVIRERPRFSIRCYPHEIEAKKIQYGLI